MSRVGDRAVPDNGDQQELRHTAIIRYRVNPDPRWDQIEVISHTNVLQIMKIIAGERLPLYADSGNSVTPIKIGQKHCRDYNK